MNEDTLLSIVVPTFNEKENVRILTHRIVSVLSEKRIAFEVIFIDDSTDETPAIIEEVFHEDARIRLIHRTGVERTGLATAFLKGFEIANGRFICCLDADLQHPPEKIVDLLDNAIEGQMDIVVGTRYAKGGGAEGLGSMTTIYGIYRHAVSLGLKYFTQIIFIPTRQTTDPLGGFFLIRKEIVQNVTFEPRGFKILVEILMRTNFTNICDVPYKFLARKNEQSKASIRQGIEFFIHLLHILRTVPEAGRLLKFCIVGLSGVAVNIGLLVLLVRVFSISPIISYLVAVIVSILSNLIFNSEFTYSDKQSISRNQSIQRVIYYYTISSVVTFLNYGIFIVATTVGLNYVSAALCGIIISMIINFVVTTKFVWKIPVKYNGNCWLNYL